MPLTDQLAEELLELTTTYCRLNPAFKAASEEAEVAKGPSQLRLPKLKRPKAHNWQYPARPVNKCGRC